MTAKEWALKILSDRNGDEILADHLDQRDFPLREVVKLITNVRCPEGFPMTIKSQDEWSFIAEAVNQGIDAHLEALTKSRFDNGDVWVHPDELGILIDRLRKLACDQSNAEFASWDAKHPGADFESSDELEERDSFVRDLVYVLCKKDED